MAWALIANILAERQGTGEWLNRENDSVTRGPRAAGFERKIISRLRRRHPRHVTPFFFCKHARTTMPLTTFPSEEEHFKGFKIFDVTYKVVKSHAIQTSVLVPRNACKGPRPVIVRFHGGGLVGFFLSILFQLPASPPQSSDGAFDCLLRVSPASLQSVITGCARFQCPARIFLLIFMPNR